jgi:C-terminal processing protease CtpA/Prc
MSQVPPDCNKTQVVIIGTIHGTHNKNPKYNPDVLKEIIFSLKPNAILNELPLSLVDPNGRPIEELRKKDISGGPESWAADTVATQLGIKQIPFDRPDREENYKKTNYFVRQKNASEMANKWGNEAIKQDPNSLDVKIAQLMSYASQAEGQLFMNSGPEVINSVAFDSIIRVRHSVWYDILPVILKKYPGYETLIDDCLFQKQEWMERNKIMADNIVKAAKEYPGKRLVIVTGSMHRYILRDLLKDVNSIDLKEYWEITPPEVNKPREINEPNQPAYLKVIPPDKLKEDLDFLFKTIEEIHPNMYAYTSKKEFEPVKNQLYEKISKSMNRLAFYKAIAPVVASLKSGHTFLQPPFEFFQNYAKAGGKYFPIEIQIDEESVILTEYQGPYALPIGAEVLTFDSISAIEFLRKAARYMPSENRPYNFAMIQQKSLFPFYLWLEKNNSDILDLRLKTTDGRIEQFQLKALSYKELANYQKSSSGKTETISPNNNTQYAYRHIQDYNVGLIEFNSFDNRKSFLEFLQNTFEKIREQNIRELIIDIRKNPGGNSTLGDDLLKYLTDKPFLQFEKIDIKVSEQLLKEQAGIPDAAMGSIVSIDKDLEIKPEENNLRFGGKIFVLIGPESASSSVSFASAVKHFHIGTLIGQETTDTPVNYGDCVLCKMPNSGLDFNVACKRFVCAGGKPDGRGVIPDYEVKQIPQDTAKSIDTTLEFALNLIKENSSKK